MKKLLLILILVFMPHVVMAQATTTSKLEFDQSAPTLSEANGYTYKYYPDGSLTGINLVVVCTGVTSPFICNTAFPTFTPGPHNITLTAGNIAGESLKSSPFAFVFVVVPVAPNRVRII